LSRGGSGGLNRRLEADAQQPVGTEGLGKVAREDKEVDEFPRRAVVAPHATDPETADVEVTVGAEDRVKGPIQPAAAGRDEDIEECPRAASWRRIARPAGDGRCSI